MPSTRMRPKEVRKILRQRAELVNDFLSATYIDPAIPPRLAESVRYSLLAGGKRLRPVLCLSSALACAEADPNGGRALREDVFFQGIMPFAAALEMIHTYSLIHDDLPAMDNDDMRRGKPTNHKAFGEGTAILAGDALLSDSFAFMTFCSVSPALLVPAIAILAEAAGARGMVGGQILDLDAEGKDLSREALADLDARKTGALIRAACQCGGVLAGTDAMRRSALGLYGEELGIAFQIIDDILDVVGDENVMGKKTGNDVARGKSTWPALLGLEAARGLAAEHCGKAARALPEKLFPGSNGEFLRQLATFMLNRTY